MSEQEKTQTWYLVRPWWPAEILPIEITRETENSVWIGNNRTAKHGEIGHYFPTWAKARDYLVALRNTELARHVRGVVEARSALDKLEKMTDPTAPAPEVEKETAQHE